MAPRALKTKKPPRTTLRWLTTTMLLASLTTGCSTTVFPTVKADTPTAAPVITDFVRIAPTSPVKPPQPTLHPKVVVSSHSKAHSDSTAVYEEHQWQCNVLRIRGGWRGGGAGSTGGTGAALEVQDGDCLRREQVRIGPALRLVPLRSRQSTHRLGQEVVRGARADLAGHREDSHPLVGDWKFGDVLALALAGHPPHRIMFIGRKTPLALNADGTLRHWPFEGIGLPSECDKSWRICGQDHGVGKMGGFGGHPSVSWGDTGWTLEEEL